MRIALISDIHGNLHALDAVLADIAARADIAATYHLGDLVGYGPFPNEVVERLKSHAIAGIAGNYDSTIGANYTHCGCRVETPEQEVLAHRSYEFTKKLVTPETRRYLAALPFSMEIRPHGGHSSGPRLVLVHGTPTLNTLYWTANRTDEFCLAMASMVSLKARDVIAFGHTHIPWYRQVGGIHFVNTGSVGRPKDQDPRAGYALMDFSGSTPTVEFVRVQYDVEGAVAAIAAAGLPAAFGESLRFSGVSANPASSA